MRLGLAAIFAIVAAVVPPLLGTELPTAPSAERAPLFRDR